MGTFSYPHEISIQVDFVLVDFTVDPPAVEMGSSVPHVVLRWNFNRDPEYVIVADKTLSGTQNVLQVAGPFTADYQWTVKGFHTTNETVTASGRAVLAFQNWGYWDVVSTAPTNSAGVRALQNKQLVSTKTEVIEGFPCYTGLFPVYCYPTRLGQIKKVKVKIHTPGTLALFDWVSFTDLTTTTVSVTNGSGFTENYFVTIFNSLPYTGFFEVDWN